MTGRRFPPQLVLSLTSGLKAMVGSSVLLTLAAGCRSSSLRPGFTNLSEMNGNTAASIGPITAEQRQWVKDYKRARALSADHAEQACEIFQKLVKSDQIPPFRLAELRAKEVCPNETGPKRDDLPPYLNDLALDIGLRLAEKNGDKATELDLAAEKSKKRLPQGEKVKFIGQALSRAQELKDESKIAALTRRLYSVAPRLNPAPTEPDYLAVAADFRVARQFDQANAYYERILRGKNFRLDDKIQALRGLRQASKNARKSEAHLAACHRLSAFLARAVKANGKSQALRLSAYDAQIFEARAQWTQGHESEAHQIFERLEKASRGRVPMGELYWLKARMAEEQKDYAAVAELLGKALKEVTTDGGLRDKIMWYSAWNERRQAHFARAADLLAQLDERTQDEFMRHRALFWLGKNLSDAKKPDEAKAVFARLIDVDPLGYYGLLAHRHVGSQISFKVNSLTAAGANGGGASGNNNGAGVIPLDAGLAEWLVQMDEREVLTTLLDAASKTYNRQSQQSDEGWISIFKYYARAGLYIRLYDSLGTLSPDHRKSIMESHPDLLFPQPWSEDVRLASLQFGVQEELIYSIMRQESAFDPRSRSQADAFGLLQILPEVAEHVSQHYKVPYTQMEDLYDPRTNIQIGAAHLKDLLENNQNQFILAVASYNANEAAIRNWMKTRFRGDALEFIEEIPYEETRTYVRLVIRNHIFYSLLRSKSAAIDFPSWLLDLTAAAS